MFSYIKTAVNTYALKVIGIIFVLLCSAFGVGPENLVKYLVEGMPTWVTPGRARLVFLVLAVLFGLIFLYGKATWLTSKIRRLYSRFIDDIQWIDEPSSIHSFGYTISRTHNLVLVGNIRLRGENPKKIPLTVKKAYLRSLVTGEILILRINELEATNLQIQPNSHFDAYAIFDNEDGILADNQISGITFPKFITKYSNFEIVFETEKKNYKLIFDNEITQKWVTSVQMGLMMPSPGTKASVLKLAS